MQKAAAMISRSSVSETASSYLFFIALWNISVQSSISENYEVCSALLLCRFILEWNTNNSFRKKRKLYYSERQPTFYTLQQAVIPSYLLTELAPYIRKHINICVTFNIFFYRRQQNWQHLLQWTFYPPASSSSEKAEHIKEKTVLINFFSLILFH